MCAQFSHKKKNNDGNRTSREIKEENIERTTIGGICATNDSLCRRHCSSCRKRERFKQYAEKNVGYAKIMEMNQPKTKVLAYVISNGYT